MGDTLWKAAERKVAKAFGTVRNALSGGNGKVSRSDTIHPKLFIETKRATRYKAAITLWDEAAKLAKEEQKTPLVALVAPKRAGFWVVCHIDHLEEITSEYRNTGNKG